MKKTGRCGLAKYRARGKQYLVLIAPEGDAIALHQLHYADEIHDVSEVPTGDAEPKDEEVALATQIIQQIANDKFEPEKYEDEVRKRTLELIDKKVSGEDIVAEPEPAEASSQVTDLMASLKASLGAKTEAPAEQPTEKSSGKKKKDQKAS
jgi:DNA end-binding protein Ku